MVNNLKITILVAGLLVMVLMGLYPPWIYQDSSGKQIPMGYSFIWAPPEEKIDKKGNIFGFKFDIEMSTMRGNSLDIWKLLVQEAMAAGITFGGAALAGKSSKNSQKEKV